MRPFTRKLVLVVAVLSLGIPLVAIASPPTQLNGGTTISRDGLTTPDAFVNYSVTSGALWSNRSTTNGSTSTQTLWADRGQVNGSLAADTLWAGGATVNGTIMGSTVTGTRGSVTQDWTAGSHWGGFGQVNGSWTSTSAWTGRSTTNGSTTTDTHWAARGTVNGSLTADSGWFNSLTVNGTFALGSVLAADSFWATTHVNSNGTATVTGLVTAGNLSANSTNFTQVGVGVVPRALLDARGYNLTHTFTSPDTDAHQGYATDGTYHYIFDTTRIDRLDSSWALLTSNSDPLGGIPGGALNHLGDGTYHNGKLYVPVEYFSSCTTPGTTTFGAGIAVYDATTLARESYTNLSATQLEMSGLEIVAGDGPTGTIYATNYCDGGKVYKYRVSDLAALGTIQLDLTLSLVQAITFKHGMFYISQNNGLLFAAAENGDLYQAMYTGFAGMAHEGLDFSTDDLRWLVDNGTSARFVHFYNAEDRNTGLTFSPLGNLGVNERAPEYPLVVNSYEASNTTVKISNANTAGEARLDMTSRGSFYRLFYRDNNKVFGIYDGFNALTRFRISNLGHIYLNEASGNVAVGYASSTTPAYKLEVNGGTRASNFTFTSSTPPTCSVSVRGAVYNEFAAAGTADKLSWCHKKVDDTYAWKEVADPVATYGATCNFATAYGPAPTAGHGRLVFGYVTLQATAIDFARVDIQVETAVGSGVYTTRERAHVSAPDADQKSFPFNMYVAPGLRYQFTQDAGAGTEAIGSCNTVDL